MNANTEANIISSLDELPFWSALFGNELLSQIQLKKDLKVLDIGCGTGFPIIQLAQMLGESATCYGIDISESAAERAIFKIKNQEIKNIQILNASAESIPFADNTFDLIISNNGLNNVNNFEIAMAEIKRIAKKDCQLVFSMNTKRTFSLFYNYLKEVLTEFNLENQIRIVDQHIKEKRPSVEKIKKIIYSTGFQLHNIIYSEFFLRYSDGTSFLNSFFIKYAFMPSWIKILPDEKSKAILKEVENKLNLYSSKEGELKMEVPFVVFNTYYLY